jgi:hypothetical protein
LGAGAYDDVPGCHRDIDGDQQGLFQHHPGCSMPPDQSFISAVSGENNFTGDITDTLRCLMQVGQVGCGFEQPFGSIQLALQRSQMDGDPNFGFLRPDAFLGIVMLTNEDDCSVPPDSLLFDLAQQSVSDPLGGNGSYRCNEFGHLCNGVAPPHNPPANPLTLTNCTSNENGPLISVGGFSTFLKGLKDEPSRIFVAAVAGNTTPYVVGSWTTQTTNGFEIQPHIQHSCMGGEHGDVWADPGVRILQLLKSFGSNAAITSICTDNMANDLRLIASAMVGKMSP